MTKALTLIFGTYHRFVTTALSSPDFSLRLPGVVKMYITDWGLANMLPAQPPDRGLRPSPLYLTLCTLPTLTPNA